MSFTQDDVKKLAHLARLALNDQKSSEANTSKPNTFEPHAFEYSIAEDLSNILQLVSTISEINTDSIAPMAHSHNLAQRCRTDSVTEPNVRDIMQRLVPENATAAGLYLVPQVVE